MCVFVENTRILINKACKLCKFKINNTYEDIKFAGSHFQENFSMTSVTNLNFLQGGDKFPFCLAAILERFSK